MSEHHDGRDHEYCEQCGDCVLCDAPHICVRQIIDRAIITETGAPMKTSWRKLLAFSNFVNGFQANGQQFAGWLMIHPEETKLSYAIKRVSDQIQKINGQMQQKFEDVDLDHCTTVYAIFDDPKSPQVIVRDAQGNLCFTVEATKAKRNARTMLLDEEEIEIEPYYATEVPETLRAEEREILTGFVIKPEEASAKLEAVADQAAG